MCSTSCFARGDQSAYRLLRNLQQFPSDTGQLGQVPGVTTVLLYIPRRSLALSVKGSRTNHTMARARG